jgi:hypothetical protein
VVLLTEPGRAESVLLEAVFRVQAQREGIVTRASLGPPPTEDEVRAAEERVIARVFREIAEYEGRGRAPWVVDILRPELHDDALARQRSTADDLVVMRGYAARGNGGRRQLEALKNRVHEYRHQRWCDIATELISTVPQEYACHLEIQDREHVGPLVTYVIDIGWRTLLAQTHEISPGVGYLGPLAMPEALCRVLLEHPESARHVNSECANCGMAIPSKKVDPPVQGFSFIRALDVCPWCGGSSLGPSAYYRVHRAEFEERSAVEIRSLLTKVAER